MRTLHRSFPSFILLGALLLGGCELTPDINDTVRYGPYYEPKNYSGDVHMPAAIRRVLVLPVAVGTLAQEETAALLDGIVASALQFQQRFEVVTLPRADCLRWYGESEFLSTAALPHGMLEDLASRYAVDAVVFTDVTAYQPYQPQALGLRSKLISMGSVRIIWNFDEIITASDPGVVNRARREALKQKGLEPIDRSPATLLSPSRFAAFAADAMFRTLPPR